MPYGKVIYDKRTDTFMCEYPVKVTADGKATTCGKWCKDLVRHITRQHRITAREYKKMMGLDMSESLMSEETKQSLRKVAKKHKLGKALVEAGKATRFKKGKVTVQNYPRSEQTKRRLRTLKLKKP